MLGTTRRILALLIAVLAATSDVHAQDAAAVTLRPDEPFVELPILTWEQQLELETTVRQVLFNAYLPLLARPTFFRGVHDDAVPNQVEDWNWHRPDVQQELLRRADGVDAQRRAHAGLPDAEVDALMGTRGTVVRKQAFRPEQLEPLLVDSPRIEDLSIQLRRVQPLGGDMYRVDFDVRTKVQGVTETTSFDTIDIMRTGGAWIVPTKILLEVAPLARFRAALGGGGGPGALTGNFLLLVESQLKDVLPFELPFP